MRNETDIGWSCDEHSMGKVTYSWTDEDYRGLKLDKPHVEVMQEGRAADAIQTIATIAKMYAMEGRAEEVVAAVHAGISRAEAL